jgi:HKD family nuclease
MQIEFVAQPFEEGTDLRDFLHAVAEDEGLNTLRVIVAWAKRSGLGRAASDLQAIRSRGGKVLTIVGLSEGGATEQGLRVLLDLSDEAYVFYDASRTFHPKVYLASGDSHALLLVGSHNLTAGGLAWNYEAGIWCKLDITQEPDNKILEDVIAFFDRLLDDTNVCVPLNSLSLAAMLADPSLIIQDEDSRSKPPSNQQDAPEETDSINGIPASETTAVFGKSQQAKRKAPVLPSQKPAVAPPRKPAPITGSVPGSRPPISITKRWYKLLEATDAQQPPGPNSNPTGNLRLTQEDFSIDHTTYFLKVFFGGLDWRPSARVADMLEVWVPMQTEIAGDYLGEVMLQISHLPSRISGQGNVPTVLHWRDLSARMRKNNYVDRYVTLERGDQSQFRLTIANQPTGPFEY